MASVCANPKKLKAIKPRQPVKPFKNPFKKEHQTTGARVKRSGIRKVHCCPCNAGSSRRRASGVDRPGKPIRPLASTSPKTTQKAWRGDIAGYKIRSKSAGSSRKNVYPQYGRYSKASPPRPTENPTSNRRALARVKRLQSQGTPALRSGARGSAFSIRLVYCAEEH